MDPIEHTFVVMSGMDENGRRLLFQETNAAVAERLKSMGVRIRPKGAIAVVPDGTKRLQSLTIPFIPLSEMMFLLRQHKVKTAQVSHEKAQQSAEEDQTWNKIRTQVRKKLRIRPFLIEAGTLARLFEETWPRYLDYFFSGKYVFQRTMYRRARSWMMGVLKRLEYAINLWEAMGPVKPKETTEEKKDTYQQIHDRWKRRWNEDTNEALTEKGPEADPAYFEATYHDLVSLRDGVAKVLDQLPVRLQAWTDQVMTCLEHGCGSDTFQPLFHYKNKEGKAVAKPYFLILQELVWACCDRQNLKPLLKIMPGFSEENCGSVMQHVKALQRRARKLMGVTEEEAILWSELIETFQDLKQAEGIDWTCFNHVITLDSKLEDKDEKELKKIGAVINRKDFHKWLKHRLVWFLRAP